MELYSHMGKLVQVKHLQLLEVHNVMLIEVLFQELFPIYLVKHRKELTHHIEYILVIYKYTMIKHMIF